MAVERWDDEGQLEKSIAQSTQDISQLLARAKKQQEINNDLLEMIVQEIRGMRVDTKRFADSVVNKKD